MDFFGIGFVELIFILLVALLVLGPNKMVDTARTLGKYIRELQRAASDIPRLLSVEEDQPRTPPPQDQKATPKSRDEKQGPNSGV